MILFILFDYEIYKKSQKWIRGAMVARLTPDQKVACSIHVGFNVNFLFDGSIGILRSSNEIKCSQSFPVLGRGLWLLESNGVRLVLELKSK